MPAPSPVDSSSSDYLGVSTYIVPTDFLWAVVIFKDFSSMAYLLNKEGIRQNITIGRNSPIENLHFMKCEIEPISIVWNIS